MNLKQAARLQAAVDELNAAMEELISCGERVRVLSSYNSESYARVSVEVTSGVTVFSSEDRP